MNERWRPAWDLYWFRNLGCAKKYPKKWERQIMVLELTTERETVIWLELLGLLKLESTHWYNYLTDDTHFHHLSFPAPLTERKEGKDTCLRKAVTSKERLTVTRRSLASGNPIAIFFVFLRAQFAINFPRALMALVNLHEVPHKSHKSAECLTSWWQFRVYLLSKVSTCFPNALT